MSIQWDKACEVIGIFDKYTVYWAFGKDCTRLKVSTVLSPLHRGGNWLQVNSFGKLCTGCSQQCCWKVYALLCVCVVWFGHEVVSDSCNPMDCSPSGSSVHGIFQARMLEFVTISFSRDLWGTMAQLVKNPPVMWETWVRSLSWEDLLEKAKATHSSILA